MLHHGLCLEQVEAFEDLHSTWIRWMEFQGLHGQMWQTVPEEMICTVLYSNNNTILGVFITIYPYPSFVSFIMLSIPQFIILIKLVNMGDRLPIMNFLSPKFTLFVIFREKIELDRIFFRIMLRPKHQPGPG